MTTFATTAGALRRAAECVLLAFGVPVTRDMPADAVFLSMDDAGSHRSRALRHLHEGTSSDSVEPMGINPANGLPMVGITDVLGCQWGSLSE